MSIRNKDVDPTAMRPVFQLLDNEATVIRDDPSTNAPREASIIRADTFDETLLVLDLVRYMANFVS